MDLCQPSDVSALSRFTVAFFSRSKHLLISWLQSPSAVIWKPKKIKSVTASTFLPSICYELMRPNAMILIFWMLNFKPSFSLSSFTFIKRFFSPFSPSAMRVVLSAYLGCWYFSQQSWFQLLILSSAVSNLLSNLLTKILLSITRFLMPVYLTWFFLKSVRFLIGLILLFSIPSSFKKIFVTFYFWLCWVFVVACGLSLVVVSGGDSGCGVRASHCRGFSCCTAWALGRTGFSSCATWAQ